MHRVKVFNAINYSLNFTELFILDTSMLEKIKHLRGKKGWLLILSVVGLLLVIFHKNGKFKHIYPDIALHSEEILDTINRKPSQTIIFKQLKETLEVMKTDVKAANESCNNGFNIHFFENIHTRFTAIPKAGNSNWKESLLIANNDIARHSTSRHELALNHKYTNRYKLNRLKLLVNSTIMLGAFTFSVVRNPWTRMVSGYKDKLTDNGHGNEGFIASRLQIVSEARGIADETELMNQFPTFEEFGKWLITHDGEVNYHFKPQTRILCLQEVTYDFIIPSEYSDQYSREVWEIIQVNTTLSGSYDGVDAASQTSTVEARTWFSELDSDVIDKLYHIFRYDFLLMNYSNFTDKRFPYPLL